MKKDITHIVYVARNIVSGGEYIGLTNGTVDRRRRQHQWDAVNGRGYCRKFHAAIRKYGADAFVWTEAGRFRNREDASAYEIELIATRQPRYNITSGGAGVSIPRTDEWKGRISAAHKGKKASPEAVENWKRAMTPEIRARIAEASRLHGFPPQARAASVASRSKRIVCIETGTVFLNATAAGLAHGLRDCYVRTRAIKGGVSKKAGVSFRYALPHEAGLMHCREAV